MDGLLNGGVIGLPPILNFGSPELRSQHVPEILGGKKYIALAITEAFAGSDVAGVQTVAVRDGDDWVVTGTKKWVVSTCCDGTLLNIDIWNWNRWITNGTFADYFTTLCQTNVGAVLVLLVTL